MKAFEQKTWLGLLALVFIFVALCSVKWTRPAIEDETLHFKCKIVWLKEGASWCELSHAPLYHEATSLWQRAFGEASPDRPESIAILRSFGAFTSLLTLLVFVFGLWLRRDDTTRLSGHPLLASALLVLNPYFVLGSPMLDYDNTVLVAPLLLVAILIERFDELKKPGWLFTFSISLAIAVAIFAKELSPIVFIGAWPLWAALRKWRAGPWKRHLGHALTGSLAALVFAFALLWLWARFRGFHWYDPLLESRAKFSGKTTKGELNPVKMWDWRSWVFMAYVSVLWFSTPALYLLFKAARPLWRKPAKLPYSFWPVAAMFGAYTLIGQASYYYSKYTFPAWPILLYVLAVHVPIPRGWPKLDFKKMGWGWALLFILGLTPLFDPLMIIEHRRELSAGVVVLHLLSISLPIVLLWLLDRKGSGKDWRPLVVGVICYFFGADLMQAASRHETGMLYGEYGFSRTIEEVRKLKARVSPDEPVLTVARDLKMALGDEARYLEVVNLAERELKFDARILVSRSYGSLSISGRPVLRSLAEATYRCHAQVPEPGNRFEWWWNPPAGESCGDASK